MREEQVSHASAAGSPSSPISLWGEDYASADFLHVSMGEEAAERARASAAGCRAVSPFPLQDEGQYQGTSHSKGEPGTAPETHAHSVHELSFDVIKASTGTSKRVPGGVATHAPDAFARTSSWRTAARALSKSTQRHDADFVAGTLKRQAAARMQPASGLKWRRLGRAPPPEGVELAHPPLSAALLARAEPGDTCQEPCQDTCPDTGQDTVSIDAYEWARVGVAHLRMEHVVRAGGAFWQPAEALEGRRMEPSSRSLHKLPLVLLMSATHVLARAQEAIVVEHRVEAKHAVTGKLLKRQKFTDRIHALVMRALDMERRALSLAEDSVDAAVISSVLLQYLRHLVAAQEIKYVYPEQREECGRQASQCFYRLADMATFDEYNRLNATGGSLLDLLRAFLRHICICAYIYLYI